MKNEVDKMAKQITTRRIKDKPISVTVQVTHYKNEEEVMRKKQEDYLKKLKKLREDQKAGKNIDSEIERIKKFWIGAGLLNRDGKVNKKYRGVIIRDNGS